jgi:hypothetical protein
MSILNEVQAAAQAVDGVADTSVDKDGKLHIFLEYYSPAVLRRAEGEVAKIASGLVIYPELALVGPEPKSTLGKAAKTAAESVAGVVSAALVLGKLQVYLELKSTGVAESVIRQVRKATEDSIQVGGFQVTGPRDPDPRVQAEKAAKAVQHLPGVLDAKVRSESGTAKLLVYAPPGDHPLLAKIMTAIWGYAPGVAATDVTLDGGEPGTGSTDSSGQHPLDPNEVDEIEDTGAGAGDGVYGYPTLDTVILAIEPVTNSYEDWLPCGSPTGSQESPGNTFYLKATLRLRRSGGAPRRKARRLVFALVKSSAEPGVCMNFPRTAKYDAGNNPDTNKPDMRLTKAFNARDLQITDDKEQRAETTKTHRAAKVTARIVSTIGASCPWWRTPRPAAWVEANASATGRMSGERPGSYRGDPVKHRAFI